MFIKLTRFDNRPIWLNASFIVTVEPRKDGVGSVVVPIGDGFDYDVRESVSEVLAKLEGAPAAAVVPVPAPDCLTKTPADVSPGPEPSREPQQPNRGSLPAAEPRLAEKPAEEKKPRKRAVRKPKAENAGKPAAKKEVETTAEAKPAEPPVETKPPPPLELSPDQVARLAKLAPKSVGKLKNTLATQFHVADVGATVLALEAKGAFALDGTRVVWPVPLTADAQQM